MYTNYSNYHSCYCYDCQKEVPYKVFEEKSTYSYKGSKVTFTEKVPYCQVCGESVTNEIIDQENLLNLNAAYLAQVELSSDDIKDIRKNYSLTQNEFSKVLQWSKATVARYETGKSVPDSTHLFMLKKLKNQPSFIHELYEHNKNAMEIEESCKIRKKITSFEQNVVTDHIFKAIDSLFAPYTFSEYSGYKKFDFDKFKHLILFFSKHPVNKTKLLKMLWYSDFKCFKEHATSISGLTYEKYPYGPVPKRFETLFDELKAEQCLSLNQEFINGYDYHLYKAQKEMDSSLFDEHELHIMNQVLKQFEKDTSRSISEKSHEESAWTETELNEDISYKYAESLKHI